MPEREKSEKEILNEILMEIHELNRRVREISDNVVVIKTHMT
jgi:hypothetical protein